MAAPYITRAARSYTTPWDTIERGSPCEPSRAIVPECVRLGSMVAGRRVPPTSAHAVTLSLKSRLLLSWVLEVHSKSAQARSNSSLDRSQWKVQSVCYFDVSQVFEKTKF